MKSKKHILLSVLVVLTILSLVLAACGPIDISIGDGDKPKDNDKDNGKDKDKGNDKDKGSEKDQEDNADKVTICHKTGSTKKPYVEITVAGDAVDEGHGGHDGDLIPAPEDGCPSTIASDLPAK